VNVIIADGGDRNGTYGSYLIFNKEGKSIASRTFYWGIGDHNQAEYWALLMALKKATELGLDDILIYTDSETVVTQVLNERPLHKHKLRMIRKQVLSELEHFSNWEIKKVDRILIYSFLGH